MFGALSFDPNMCKIEGRQRPVGGAQQRTVQTVQVLLAAKGKGVTVLGVLTCTQEEKLQHLWRPQL